MPASLVEAFISPFDKVPGGRPPVMSSGSTDIRNGGGGERNYGDGRDAYGHSQPGGYSHVASAPAQCQPEYQQDYRISDVVTEADDLKATYSNGNGAPHDCDRLIAQIMSCSVCRKKLQKIMAQEVHDAAHGHGHEEEQHHRRQSGGFGGSGSGSGLLGEFTDLLHSDFLVNFLIGIAVIYLLDRIIAMKLR